MEEVRRRLRDAVAPLLPPFDSWPNPLLPPAYVKLVGLEGEMALMELSPEQLRAYFSKHPAVYEVRGLGVRERMRVRRRGRVSCAGPGRHGTAWHDTAREA